MEHIDKQQAAPATGTTLAYLPVALFGSVMGLTGLALAWRAAHAHFGAPAWIASGIGWIAIAAFVALAIAYALKAASGFDSVRNEFRHPIAGNLFGTPLISLLLLPMLLADITLPLARGLWLLGAAGMTLFAWLIVSRWMSVQQNITHATPAWIIPVVGMLDVPLAVPSLQFEGIHGFMLFALAIGLFFAIPLFTLIFSRLLFQEAMPAALQPSLLILVAPFAVGFSSYVTSTGKLDAFAGALYMLMLFLLAVLAGRLRHLASCCPFRVSWWSVSFPLAASASAALRYAAAVDTMFADGVAMFLLAFATIAILGLLLRTLAGIARGELRALSG
ncbi:SLAC1 anion channel family protein [Janthinobacterium agaricidamnosum]|uniref:C4-dicarboxylate transporter/malic acid transport family protein n=1 Tax=Janthinobacterium agaricidamnosum NBRC 102515 = DSM 9628 TaxID=1349767 RepID=W0UXW8_9BURK|nr:SLAC1 anion channel family protein [Janthinobacterium agaricidamnosum]CDG81399.1 C4-dicarboxylate transporter/malic acid transport family protein [Janthinobacterium agaricidamnosum NBRC 102515 = DSM 9628]